MANRVRTREFRSILREVRKLRDWMVERNGFEPSVPLIRHGIRCLYTQLLFFVPLDRALKAALFLHLADLVVARTEMEDSVELRAGEDSGAEASQIHRAVDRSLFQPPLLRGNLGDAARIVVGLLFEHCGGKGARRKAHRLGLLAADPAARQEGKVLRAMRPDHPVPERADVAGARGDRGKADTRIIGDEDHIRTYTELGRACQAIAR